MRLPVPGCCSLELLEKIVAERQNGVNAAFFNGIAAEWRTRVQQYIAHGGSPGMVPVWPAIELKRRSFLNLYLAPAESSVQGVMLKQLRDHDLSLCPACGEAGRPNTLDHYLPKITYPQFCVTPLNLFPMCDACQNSKGEKTGDNVTPRFFIHPYFDAFIAEQVLRLTISPPYDKPSFDLVAVDTLEPEQKMLVQSHVRELEIPARYARFFKTEHRRLLRLVAKMRQSEQDVEDNLKIFRQRASFSSHNSWEHIFFAAALDDEQFLEFLKSAVFPAHL